MNDSGRYYYEIEVYSTASSPQIGWAARIGFDPIEGYTGSGVGDDTASWGFDGHRLLSWHGGSKSFGKAWNVGDTLGLAIDLVSANKTVSFSVNGDFSSPCGVAYSNIVVPSGSWIFPAFTAQTGKYRVNFGDRPFKYTPPALYQSVHSVHSSSSLPLSIGINNVSTEVVIKNHRNVGTIFTDGTVQFHNFNTFVGDIQLIDGKYYYEIEVHSLPNYPQFGWATSVGFDPVKGYTGKGVGDDTASWGFDGHRIQAWHGSSKSFGKAWNVGDTLGLAIDLVSANKTVSFSVNGEFASPCGVAYNNVVLPSGGWIFPAFTAQTGTYRVNFGDRPFKYAPPDSTYVAVNAAVRVQ